MGEARYIVVRDLQFEDGEFSQMSAVFTGDDRYVSWEPTADVPKKQGDKWFWLAGNTLRVKKKAIGETSPQRDSVQSVRTCFVDGLRHYTYDLNLLPRHFDRTLVHLALPPTFTVGVDSLDGHNPFYAKLDRGRVCLDWIFHGSDPVQFSFGLIKCEEKHFLDTSQGDVDAILSKGATEQQDDTASLFKEPPDPAKASLPDEWLKRTRNKPAIALVIVVATIVISVLSWTTDVIDKAKRLGEMIGRAKHVSDRRTAYDLAENVVWISFYETGRSDSVPQDIQKSANQKYAELGTELDDLGIKVDYKHLDYDSLVIKNYQDSEAAMFLRDQLTAKRDSEAQRAYDLGLKVRSMYFRATMGKFSKAGLESLFIDLSALNGEAERFGAKEIKLDDIDFIDDEALNVSMQVKIEVLDGEIKNKL